MHQTTANKIQTIKTGCTTVGTTIRAKTTDNNLEKKTGQAVTQSWNPNPRLLHEFRNKSRNKFSCLIIKNFLTFFKYKNML